MTYEELLASYRFRISMLNLTDDCNRLKEEYELVIPAIEKQIAAEKVNNPKDAIFDYYGTQDWDCPKCGYIATFTTYCSYCGQKLKFPKRRWGDGAKDD